MDKIIQEIFGNTFLIQIVLTLCPSLYLSTVRVSLHYYHHIPTIYPTHT